MIDNISQTGVTSAAEWRKPREEGVEFHFPSGQRAKVRPVNTDTFIKLGRIPDILSPIVSKAISGELDMNNLTLQELADLTEIYNIFCKTCFVYPRVVDEVQDPENEITPDDIPDFDKVTIFQFMGAPARTLESFRPFEEKPVDSVVSKPRHKTGTKRTT